MKRRHTRDDVMRFVDKVRKLRPGAVFGADIIAGFPTETDAAFANSLSLVRNCELIWLHVFPYSERPGTPAAKMPRFQSMFARIAPQNCALWGRRRHFASLIHKLVRSLTCWWKKGSQGRTPHFADVRLDTEPGCGLIVPARIVAHDKSTLIGKIAA